MRAIKTWEEGFWRHVDKGEENACWNWTATKDRDGYGQLRSFRRGMPAHRASWEFHFGLPTASLLVLHHCDNPSCVNPKHLWLGTEKDNMQDCLKKGRKNTKIPITEAAVIVEEYRRRAYTGNKKAVMQDIASRYNASWLTIRALIYSRTI